MGTIINRSPAEVAAYAGDPAHAPEWYVNIRSVEWKTPPPVAVVMRTADGTFPMETTYAWESVGEGSRMTLGNRGMPSGFSRMAAPLMEKAMRRAITKDLARLKSILER